MVCAIFVVRVTGHSRFASYLLVHPNANAFRYRTAHHSATKLATGNFCLTHYAFLRFKSYELTAQKNKHKLLVCTYFFGAGDRT